MLTGQAVISSDGRGANIAFSWTGLVGEDADDIGAPLHFLIKALQGVGNRYEDRGVRRSVRAGKVLTYGATIRDEGHREHERWAGRSIR